MGKNKKGKKNKKAKVDPIIIDQPIVTAYDNSFAFCITNITGIPGELFSNIDYVMSTVGGDNWSEPYLTVLRHHSYDMIFFEWKGEVIEVTDDVPIERWKFTSLPSGKCVVIGGNADNGLKCVTGQMRDAHVEVIYDPDPGHELVRIHQIGYFISTFVTPDQYIGPESEDDDPVHTKIS